MRLVLVRLVQVRLLLVVSADAGESSAPSWRKLTTAPPLVVSASAAASCPPPPASLIATSSAMARSERSISASKRDAWTPPTVCAP